MKGFTVQLKRWLPGVLLLSILVVAAYLRIYKIENYLTFLGDEGRDVLVVKRMIVDHKFTLLGPTASVGGFFLGPMYYYFMVPFLWAWNLSPVGPAVMVALFGVATVYLVYLVGLRFFGIIAGLVAASLYAVSPLVIAYSRSSWNPNIVPFFATLLVYLLWVLAIRKRQWSAFAIGVVLGIGIQLHYLFLFLFVLVGVWYGLLYKTLPLWRIVGFTVAGVLVGASPFIAFELRHDFSNTRTIIKFILAGDETGFSLGGFFQTLSDVSFRLFSRIVFRMPPTELWNGYPDWYITTLSILSHIARLVMVGFVAVSVFMMRKKKELLLLALWVAVSLILFGFYKRGIYDYYFGIMFAFPFLLFGWLAQSLWKKRLSQLLVGSAWIALVFFNWQGRPFIYPPNNQLAQVRTIAQTAFDQTGGEPFNFALITDGNSDHAYRYFFEIWGNPPVVIQNTDVDPERTSVTKQLIVICETIDCQPLGHPLWEIAGFGRAQAVGSWDAPFVTIHKLVPYEE